MTISLSMVPPSMSRPSTPVAIQYGFGNPSQPRVSVLEQLSALTAKELVEPRGKATPRGINRLQIQHVRLQINAESPCDLHM